MVRRYYKPGRMALCGIKKTLFCNDIETNQKYETFNERLIVVPSYNTHNNLMVYYRDSDSNSPPIPLPKPPMTECEPFLECMTEDKTPKTDYYLDCSYVSVLEFGSDHLSLREDVSKKISSQNLPGLNAH
jgi:hypothetical protein